MPVWNHQGDPTKALGTSVMLLHQVAWATRHLAKALATALVEALLERLAKSLVEALVETLLEAPVAFVPLEWPGT